MKRCKKAANSNVHPIAPTKKPSCRATIGRVEKSTVSVSHAEDETQKKPKTNIAIRAPRPTPYPANRLDRRLERFEQFEDDAFALRARE